MGSPTALDLTQPRTLGDLLGACFGLYRGYFRTFATIALVIVVPVELIVSGVGVGQLWLGYDPEPSLGILLAQGIAYGLVSAPLVTAMQITAVIEIGAGRAPSARASLRAGLDVFAPLLGAVLLFWLGLIGGFLLLIVPGIYLMVRWYFTPQAVVVDGRRGRGALARSGELVKGSWWRVFGIAIVFGLIATLPLLIAGQLIAAAAEQADSGALLLAGTVLTDALAISLSALLGTLLYFDLRARREGAPPDDAPANEARPEWAERPEAR